MVIAVDDPLVGVRAAPNGGDHVVERPGLPVEGDCDVHPRGPRAYVVSDGQRAPPRLRRDWPAELGQERLSVAVADRKHRDLGEGLRIGDGEASGAGLGGPTGRERVAGVGGHVHDAAALHALRRPHRALGVHVVHEVPVVARVGVDDAADGAVLGRDLGLDAAPRLPVTRDHDPAADADAEAVEDAVVVGDAVVHVHQLAGDVAVGGVGVEGRELVGLAAGGVLGEHGLAQAGGEALGRDHFEPAAGGPGHQRLELLDASVEPEGSKPRQNGLGYPARALGAGLVRHGRQRDLLGAQRVAARHGAERGLAASLVGEHRGREAAHRRPGLGRKRRGERRSERERQQRGGLHRASSRCHHWRGSGCGDGHTSSRVFPS